MLLISLLLAMITIADVFRPPFNAPTFSHVRRSSTISPLSSSSYPSWSILPSPHFFSLSAETSVTSQAIDGGGSGREEDGGDGDGEGDSEGDSEGDGEGEEYEYVTEEFDLLTEDDFAGSEWKIGTLMDNSDKITTTWVRLTSPQPSADDAINAPADNFLKRVQGNKQAAVWGDDSKGTWAFDATTQFLSISKDTPLGLGGKKIWAVEVDDYYFLNGGVRGWSPWAACDNLGQWQAIRLGVDDEERGVAPWKEEGWGEDVANVAEENEGGEGDAVKV